MGPRGYLKTTTSKRCGCWMPDSYWSLETKTRSPLLDVVLLQPATTPITAARNQARGRFIDSLLAANEVPSYCGTGNWGRWLLRRRRRNDLVVVRQGPLPCWCSPGIDGRTDGR